MQICDRICDRIFCQNPHIAYFSTYNGISIITYAMRKLCRTCKNSHICRIFSHMQLHFLAFFLSSVVLTLLIILAANLYRYLQLDIELIEVKDVKTVQKKPINDYDYDSLSLEFVYAIYMRHMHHICRICICRIFAPHILPNSAYFSAYFASKSSACFKIILRYKPTSLMNVYPRLVTGIE